MYTKQPKKMLIINILDILKRHSDQDHRLSQKDILRFADDYTGTKYRWDWALRIFGNAPPITDYNKKFTLWLYFGEDAGEETAKIIKVIWAVKDENGKQSLKRFVCSEYMLSLDEAFFTDYLFYSKVDYLDQAVIELEKKSKYKIKYIGEKGHPRDDYCCPKRDFEFGLHPFGEKGCRYCRYCGLISYKQRSKNRQWNVYCCYPNSIREPSETHPGYECTGINEYPI